MKQIATIVILLLTASIALGQVGATANLKHREAMKTFLASNPSYMPLVGFDEGTLKAMREEWGFGRTFTPYYATGDFNGDGQGDFAVILAFQITGSAPVLEPHVLVFNGSKYGKFTLAHTEREDPSTGLFIHSTKTTGLYVGIAETDSAGCFKPKGKGYQVKPCGGR